MSNIASVSTAWCPPSVCSVICAAVGASITIPLLNATRNPTSGGRGRFIWSELFQVFSLNWARSTWCSRFDSDGIKFVTFPLNPIRSMTQLQFVEKLALQLMTNSIGESSEDGEEASSSHLTSRCNKSRRAASPAAQGRQFSARTVKKLTAPCIGLRKIKSVLENRTSLWSRRGSAAAWRSMRPPANWPLMETTEKVGKETK